MESIVHFSICKSSILYFLKYISFILVNIVLLLMHRIAPIEGNLLHLEGMYGLMPRFSPGMGVRGFPLISALFKAILFLTHYFITL